MGRAAKPRVGFLGTGWIGRDRMAAMIASGSIEPVAVCEPGADNLREALALAPGLRAAESLDALLALGLDGVVIATPSALHAAQSIRALEAGAAVFCQKPLGRDAGEAAAVVAAARAADRLLGLDLSYRFTEGVRQIGELLERDALGRLFAIDLTFHNAYGPDKPWFYDRAQAGGGCVMDLGIHLADLALWLTGFPDAEVTDAALYAGGAALTGDAVEDYAVATVRLGDGVTLRLACSWRLHAGQDAVIEAAFYGAGGGAALRNIGGSFYDFTAEHFRGTARQTLALPPDDWGGRAAVDWAERLAVGARFDEGAERFVRTAALLDSIYARARER
ncbi:Gfo/Idh/MocA family protein [Sphingomonas yunnanensis]|uniref:Gfo/Idh/MocA family protein n=1 Tax=Sphingomonas yunnanensis TaxID=310400 RepID=UPI001FE9E542|nr:Gfo/Idh/MocA family oxidoreductase [Sphingomonas yunnanensis]